MKQILGAFLVVAFFSVAPRAQAPAQADVNILGNWAITTTSPVGETTNNMEISKDGDKLRAVAKGENGGEAPYDKAELKGNEVMLVITIDYQGQPMTITYTGLVEGTKMSGDADFGGLAQGTWAAVKR